MTEYSFKITIFKNGVLDPYTSLLLMQNTDKVKLLKLQRVSWLLLVTSGFSFNFCALCKTRERELGNTIKIRVVCYFLLFFFFGGAGKWFATSNERHIIMYFITLSNSIHFSSIPSDEQFILKSTELPC